MSHNTELLEKLARCAAACEMCADACLDEGEIKKMVPCIRLDRDCAKACHVTASYVAAHSEYAQQFVNLCADICKACGDECARHEMGHCQECAKACRECEEACRSFAGVGV